MSCLLFIKITGHYQILIKFKSIKKIDGRHKYIKGNFYEQELQKSKMAYRVVIYVYYKCQTKKCKKLFKHIRIF